MKVGAVVQLKSGGSKMTVTEIAGSTVKTQWQQDKTGKITTGEFPVAGLKVVDEKAAAPAQDEDEEEDEEEEEEE